jgi:hypothetical protein
MLAVWRDYDHPGILFSPNEIPAEQCDDGSIMVDLRESIVLPEQTDAWTDQHCTDAYRILANVDQSDVAPECTAGLMCQFVGAYELHAICANRGEEPPPFWRRFKRPRKKLSRKEEDLQPLARLVSWFQCKIDAGERLIHEQFRAEAEKVFSISGQIVEDAWNDFAPEKWKLPGRPPGSRNRH